ncbi:MAG: hypothetical protein ACI7YS_15635 [Flavobacterium sp.]
MKVLKLLLFILSTNSIFCQTNQRLEDSVHIYWQPNIKLKNSDFKSDGRKEENAEKYCEKIKLCACAATNFNVIIDIPKNKKKRKKLFEKIYLVPVLEKTKSYNLTKDTIGLLRQKIVFDIEEWTTRYIRKEIEKTTSLFEKKYGSIITWHNTIIREAKEKREKLIHDYTLYVYLEPKDNAYENWRLKIDKLLEETKEYATKPEDCIRFIQQKPLDEEYEQLEFLGDS